MPWHLSEDKKCVIKDGESEPLKCYDTEAEAKDYLAALYASEDKSVKIGARNNRKDQERLQMIHDYSAENGAICDKKSIDIDIEKTFVMDGGAVKALPDNKVGGYLVRFTEPGDLDLTGDFFTKNTDLGEPSRVPVVYHHGLDETLKRRRIGTGETRVDDVGLWVEAQLLLRDEYEKNIYAMAQAGKLGWSSGAAAHVVDKEPTGKGMEIRQWYIAEASLTPTPAEPRNSVIPLKALLPLGDNTANQAPEGTAEAGQPAPSEGGEATAEKPLSTPQGELKGATMDLTPEQLQQIVADGIKQYRESEPPIKTAEANITVTKAEGDQPWASKGEFFVAVKAAGTNPMATDQRLLALKASGLNEAIPSQGGFLVPPEISKPIIDSMFRAGSLLGAMKMENISSNRMIYNVVDETSRADGSRNGGVLGYWLAEAASKTSSKPAFRQLDISAQKVVVLAYATDELLADAPALESWLNGAVPDELRFKVEDAIINGDGVGKPLGILTNADALTSATRTDASEIDAYDIGRMWAGRIPGFNDYIWVGNQGIFPQLLNLVVGTTPVFLPAGGLGGMPYATILGRPYFDIEYAPALGTAGDLLLFSPSAYKLVQNGGINGASSIHVKFESDETTFRWVWRVGGSPTYNAQTTLKDTGKASPYVVLTAST